MRANRALLLAPVILHDIADMAPARVIGCVLLGVSGVLTQSVSMVGLVYLVSQPAEFESYVRAQLTTLAHEEALLLFWLLICITFVLGSLIEHQSRKMAVSLAIDFEQHSIKSEVRRASLENDAVALRNCHAFLIQGPHYLGRVVLEFFWNVAPFFTGVVAFVALAFLDLQLAIFAIICSVLAFPVLRSTNKSAAYSTKRLRERAGSHAAKRKALRSSLASQELSTELNAASFSSQSFLRAYRDRLVATHLSLLSAKLVSASILLIAIYPLLLVSGDSPLKNPQAGVALVVLLMVFSGMRAAYKFTTKFNIFYPYLSAYKGWVDAQSGPDAPEGKGQESGLMKKLSALKDARDQLIEKRVFLTEQLRAEKIKNKDQAAQLSKTSKALCALELQHRKTVGALEKLQLARDGSSGHLGVADEKTVLAFNSSAGQNAFYSAEENRARYETAAQKILEDNILQLFIENVSTSATSILDAGCGLGRNAAEIARRFPAASIFAFDWSAAAIANAENVKNTSYFVHDIYQSTGRTYAGILCSEVLEHLEAPELAVRVLLSQLAPEGTLVLTVPNGRTDTSVRHINFWSPSSWKKFISDCSPGASLTGVRHVGAPLGSEYNWAVIKKRGMQKKSSSFAETLE